jgi:serine/threonine protein kinase
MERISESEVEIEDKISSDPGRMEYFKVRHSRTRAPLLMKKIYVLSVNDASILITHFLSILTLDHENILKIISTNLEGRDRNFNYFLIFSEAFEEGNLAGLIRSCRSRDHYLSENKILSYLTMLVDALSYMQEQKTAHRDIRPESIYICENGLKVKIGELDKSSKQEQADVTNIIGSPLYLSPAQRQAYAYNIHSVVSQHNVYKSDVYSLGLTFLYLASLRPVNDLTGLNNIQNKIERRINEIEQMYPILCEILNEMLCVDEYFRCDFIGLKELLCRKIKKREVLNSQIYQRMTQRLNALIEFSNVFCYLCKQLKEETDVFVYYNGLVCKNCKNFI